MRPLLIAVRMTVVTLIVTGLAYPLLITGLSQLFFASKANGSIVQDDRGQATGSELIGQAFTTPGYFQPRPSAAGAGYDALASSGSNLGPTSKKLQERVAAELERLRTENREAAEPVPAELLMASGSGLDPHLSPEAAAWQLPRIARARGVSVDRLRTLLDSQIEPPDLWVLGEPRVNVLLLNLAMDRQFGRALVDPKPAIGG